jgi:uncharacterized membrane protein
MLIAEHDFLRWFHVLAMVYWLGGEWGVFQTSYNVANPRLSLEERRRHMETAYRIDILARSGIILLLPIGLHMGYDFGAHPWSMAFVHTAWVLSLAWLTLCWAAFVKRDTDAGLTLTIWDERIRYVLIPLLAGTAIVSLVKGAPFTMKWYAAKVLIYSFLLVIGLGLRFIMRHWVTIFRQIAAEGATPVLEQRLSSELAMGRALAYVYWIGIATVALLGIAKPF